MGTIGKKSLKICLTFYFQDVFWDGLEDFRFSFVLKTFYIENPEEFKLRADMCSMESICWL